MQENKKIIAPLLKYLPYLGNAAEKSAVTTYKGDGIEASSVPFPVYDSTLLAFIKEADRSVLMDRNYPYTYTRNNLKTHDQERRFILAADWRQWDALRGILSKYVLGGRTRSVLWSEGVSEQIFYLVLSRMQEITEFWTSKDNNQ